MLKLLAIAPEDGHAFYEENNVLYSIRLVKWEPEICPPGITVERAICRHDFHAIDKTFENLEQLREYLRTKLLESRRQGYFTP